MTTAADTDTDRLEDRGADGPRIEVRSEPLEYRRDTPTSYYRDFILRKSDPEAADRLDRHGRQMDEVLARRQQAAERALERAGLETRVKPNPTQGQGGYFTPPLWLIEEFATAPRPRRVLADLAPHFDLPQGVTSVNLPSITTGTDTATQQPGGQVPSRDAVDSKSSSAVVTITGEADVSLQLLEQSPAGAHLDWAFFQDLTESYDAKLEGQMLTGTGTGQTLTGVITAATTAVTYTDGSPTGAALYTALGKTAAQFGDARFAPPECWLMRTARWSWLASAEDTTSRPFLTPDNIVGPLMAQPVTALMGWPVFLDDAIPATLGAASNQDAIVAIRPSDTILLEAQPRTAVIYETLSGTLGARLQLRNYAAFVPRRVLGIATVTGTGLIVQSGY